MGEVNQLLQLHLGQRPAARFPEKFIGDGD